MSGWVRRNWLGTTLVLLLALGIVGVSKMKARMQAAPPTEAPPVNVQVQTVALVPEVPDMLDLPAVVEANRVVKVSAEVAGRIEKIAVREGSRVAAGELLVQINTDLLKAAVDRADASVKYDRSECERKQKLVAGGATPAREAEEACMHLAISQAQFNEAKALLDRARIVAPAAGICNQIPVEEGEYVTPGTPVVELVDVDTVKVCVEVPERDISYFRTGATAEALADVQGQERTFTGSVTYISETANNLTRSTRMEIAVSNPDHLLRSGQIVRARLTRRVLRDVIMVPLLAVIPLEDRKTVFVVQEGGVADRRTVVLGAIRGTDVQVLSGLKTGESLIVSGHQFVGPGQKVRIVQPEKTQ